MKSLPHICHLTTVHPRSDARILLKECVSLRQAGYAVTLLVADGRGAAEHDGVKIIDVGQGPNHRLARMLVSQFRAARAAFALDALVYHFHDPELIPLGILLMLSGRKVIYDAHEDLARSFSNRPWIPAALRPLLRLCADIVELGATQIIDYVVAATPTIAARFSNAVVVRNWPILSEFPETNSYPNPDQPAPFVYVGSVAVERGALAMIEAVNHPMLAGRARLLICGAIEDPGLREAMLRADRGRHVEYAGYLSRSEVARALGAARAGLVVLQPSKAYLDSLPVKLFEYLAAGRPIIASHFPVWRNLPGLDKLGLFVDPTSPAAIADAMRWILDHPREADALGKAGRTLAHEQYSWAREQAALLRLYAWMLPAPALL